MSELAINLKAKAATLRKDIIEMIGIGHRGHFGGSLSCADVVAALYFYKMKHDPKNPKMEDRDRFILSKGHSAPAQYAALAECGYFDRNELKNLKSLGSFLQGHPDTRKVPGVEANTGSLGQGLSLGSGMAIGLKMSRIKSKVYVLVGDGEINEGQIWEAAMSSAHYKLDNLIAIVDRNNIQAMGFTKDRLDTGDISEKWKSFGWNVIEIDGNDMEQIIRALDECDTVTGRPTVIIANTIKGKGLKIAENTASFHNNELNSEQYEKALQDLNTGIGVE